MKSCAELDTTIERLEKSLVDVTAEDARVERIDKVIKELTSRHATRLPKAPHFENILAMARKIAKGGR
jgi:hypothetical protein